MAKKNNYTKGLMKANLVLLGLLMLVPGFVKLFIQGPAGVAGFLSQNVLLSWGPAFWAWILIIAEIGSGIAILTRWKLKYTAWVPVIILAVAVLTVVINWSSLGSTSWPSVILHLIAITNYLMLTKGCKDC